MPKKILMVCDSLGGGGAERQLTLMATSMVDPWQVSVFALEGGLYSEELQKSGIPLTISPRKFRLDPSPLRTLWGHMGKLKPDIVHSWGWMASFAAETCCRRWKIPHVSGVIRRGMIPPRKSLHLKIASSLGDLVLANSQAGLDAFGIPPGRGRVLYNGFAPERLERADFDRPDLHADPGGRFHIVMAATMDDRKDFPLFIRTAEELLTSKQSAAKFTALGSGSDFDALVSSAADLIQAGHFFFPGRVSEVLDYYDSAHVGVLLSTYGEGFSNAIMEYMVGSLPVVCTDQGGNRELVVDGITGFLIPPADAEALAEKLTWLETNREKALTMGREGRKRIEAEFSVAKMIERTTDIYSEVLIQE
jgi:glycosyltransferase involved in cell wall biosynthesis